MLRKLKWRMSGETYRETYRVRRLLFRTGFSTIYEAEDRNDGQSVALKVLNETGERIARKLQRGAQTMWEGELLRALNHPNIVRGFDCRGGKRFWIAMEKLDKTVFSYLKNSSTGFDEAGLISIFYDVARALDYMHAKGLIHRDIAPDNIMLKNGRAKLIDLGMTIPAGSAVAKGRVGTPSYMSPEIIRNPTGSNSAPDCDIYALGVVMYELVTGIKLFGGRSKEERMTRVLNVHPTAPSEMELKKVCSQRLEELIMRCLSKDPRLRPKKTGEVVRALKALRNGSHPRHVS